MNALAYIGIGIFILIVILGLSPFILSSYEFYLYRNNKRQEKLINEDWNLFTLETLPPSDKKFYLLYKGFIWEGINRYGSISGRSPCGEIVLDTNVGRILEHDMENKDQTKWRAT